ncbi:MAG TPA: NAD(+)/NADH kinase [Polyangia bacterium]
MSRVGLLLKRAKPEAVEIADELKAWLGARGHEAVIVGGHESSPHGARFVDDAELAVAIDLLVVLGGDGTLLHGGALVADRKVPILGINLGHLGFLTSCAPADAKLAIERALAGELPLEERLRLRVDVVRGSGERTTRYACNDAVVSQGALARLIELDAFLDDRLITRYRADGLIMATPTGSTAYTLAAGGPIVTPEVRAFVVTPICPHALTNRPVVVPASSRVMVRLGAPAEHVQLTVDGQWGTGLGADDRVEISAATEPLRLFRSPQSYFDVLREKMNWGEK